jgi:hypothetical protein
LREIRRAFEFHPARAREMAHGARVGHGSTISVGPGPMLTLERHVPGGNAPDVNLANEGLVVHGQGGGDDTAQPRDVRAL